MMKLVYSQETERILEPPQINIEDTMGGFEDEIQMREIGRFNPYLNDPTLSICQMELCPFGRFVFIFSSINTLYHPKVESKVLTYKDIIHGTNI